MATLWVYPRVGGGTWSTNSRPSSAVGLSPRGRGNLVNELQAILSRGSIPAWAGEPMVNQPRITGLSEGSIPAWAGEPSFGGVGADTIVVYPRVGGGTANVRSVRVSVCGLSPRGRGNLLLGA